uniref:LAGLIDADG endonuclease n=1 Tax=Morchella brunnea TaxID=1174671 RepID=A0A8K1I5N8_9PEZI|nr:LAGLIDADG endonuclease [Morchella brunnea]UBU98585.1 LAGLIDADG endonuclease [Morchella brunnea]
MNEMVLLINLPGGGPPLFLFFKKEREGDFRTLAMPCLNYYYDLFYKDKVKTIPRNLGELLTASSEEDAFWIMDDGGKSVYNQTILHTRAFIKEDIIYLQSGPAPPLSFISYGNKRWGGAPPPPLSSNYYSRSSWTEGRVFLWKILV